MAVCADVYTETKDNPYFGQTKSSGYPDTDEKVTKVCIAFLTTEAIEIAGDLKPRYVSIWPKLTWGTEEYPSKLREFIKGWFPSIKNEQLETLDLEKLIGQGAYLTIVHNTKGEKTYANISAAAKPPAGVMVPVIPADFIRHKDKDASKAPAAQAAPTQAAPPAANEADDDLPF